LYKSDWLLLAGSKGRFGNPFVFELANKGESCSYKEKQINKNNNYKV